MANVIVSDNSAQSVILCEQIQGPSGSLGAPSGTGFVHDTAGSIDAAARAVNLASNGVNGDVTGVAAISNGGTGLSALGTALQVLQVNSGGTALVYGNVPLATVVAPTGAGVAMVGSVTSGVWSAAALNGSAGQIFVCNATPYPAWVTASQDATVSASGAFTVKGIQTNTVTSGALTKGDLFIATTTSNWAAVAAQGDVVFSTATPGLTSVQHIYGASVPTGTGLVTGNVLQVTGSSALTYAAVNLAGGSGYVTGNLPVTNIAPSANTGYVLTTTTAGTTVGWAAIPAVAPGTQGQVYMTNGTPAATWTTVSGDVAFTFAGAAGASRVESLQYGQTAAATIDSSAGTINFALGASAVGITQTTITSTATPYNMVFTPQTSTHASGTTGHFIVNLQPPTAANGITTSGCLKCQTSGVTTFAVQNTTYWGNSLFFADPATGNAVLYNNGNPNASFLNANTEVVIALAASYFALVATAGVIAFGQNMPGANFQFGSIAPDSTSGGALYIASSTNPVHAISGGCAIYADHTSGAFCAYGPGDTSTTGPTFSALSGTWSGGSGQALGINIPTGAAATNPFSVTITSQGANASSTTKATNTPGNVIAAIPAVGTNTQVGAHGFFQVYDSGTLQAAIGVLQAGGGKSAIYLGPGVSTTGYGTAALYSDGSSATYLNAPSGIVGMSFGGATTPFIGRSATSETVVCDNYNFALSAGATGSYGGGQAVIGLVAANTIPSTAPSGGGVIYCGNSSGDAKVLNWWDTNTSNLAFAASGTSAGIIWTQHTGAQVNIGLLPITSGTGSDLALSAGSTSDAGGGAGGHLYLQSGSATNAGGGNSGGITIATGNSAGSNSGALTISTGTAASSVGNISLSPGGTLVLSCQSGLVGLNQPLGGLLTSSTFSFASTSSAIAFGSGGTQTVSTSEMATPVLTCTCNNPLTSMAILDFTTVCTTTSRPGFFLLDISGMNLGETYGIKVVNGSANATYTTSNSLFGTLLCVVIQGANSLAIR